MGTNNTNTSGNNSSMARDEKIRAMAVELSEKLKYARGESPEADFEGAMAKLARYAVDNGKAVDKICKEVENYKVESIHLKVDADDNRKKAAEILAPLKMDNKASDVATLGTLIGYSTAVSGEDPVALAHKCVEMGVSDALEMFKKEKGQQQEMSESARIAMQEKARRAQEAAEYLWPGANYKANVHMNKTASGLGKQSYEFQVPVLELAEAYFGLSPELAAMKFEEDREFRKGMNDSRTPVQKAQAELAEKYVKQIKEELWGNAKGTHDMSSFTGKAAWHCAKNGIDPSDFVEEFRGKTPTQALDSFKTKYDVEKQINKTMSPEELNKARQEHAKRTSKAIAALGYSEDDAPRQISSLASGLATQSMEKEVDIVELAEEYVALDMSPIDMLEEFQNRRKAESISQSEEPVIYR